MLVLTRREQQEIRIGENITIKVLRTRTGDVRLGIECPREIPVVRSELLLEGDSPPAAA